MDFHFEALSTSWLGARCVGRDAIRPTFLEVFGRDARLPSVISQSRMYNALEAEYVIDALMYLMPCISLRSQIPIYYLVLISEHHITDTTPFTVKVCNRV